MFKKKRFARLRVFREGFIAGLFSGVALRLGFDIDRAGLLIKFVDMFCFEGLDCMGIISFLSLFALVITIYSIAKEVIHVNEFKFFRLRIPGIVFGLLIYFVAFSLGVMVVGKI